MKRAILVTVDVETEADLRQVAKNVGYAAWAGTSDETQHPKVHVATSKPVTDALLDAWEQIDRPETDHGTGPAAVTLVPDPEPEDSPEGSSTRT